MSRTTLTASQMQNAINELNASNNEYKARVNEMGEAQQTLMGTYQGDAANAFNAAFQGDFAKWGEFAALIDQYVEALSEILTIYNETEAANTEIAKNRTYG